MKFNLGFASKKKPGFYTWLILVYMQEKAFEEASSV